MKQLLVTALWVVAAWNFSGCGEDEWAELKSRCLNTWCKVFERCSVNPDDYTQCLSSCDAFNNAGSGEEWKDYFLCKEKCVKDATPATECTCILKPEHGGPDC